MCAQRAPSACVFSTARSCDLAAIFSALNYDKQYPEMERWMIYRQITIFSLCFFFQGDIKMLLAVWLYFKIIRKLLLGFL